MRDVPTSIGGLISGDSKLWLSFVCALVVCALVTPLVIYAARRIGAIDAPDDDRRIHERPTPRLGGVAMLIAILGTTAYYVTFSAMTTSAVRHLEQLMAIMTCAAGVSLLGALDDWRGLSWKPKLLGQVALASGAVFAPLAGIATSVHQLILPVKIIDPPFVPAVHFSDWMGAGIAVLSIVALMNMMNFIDGVDGLAAGIAAISSASLAIIAASYGRGNVAILAASTSGASAGFLIFNFARGGARIFMGDAGSMLLGYLLATIALQGVLKTTAAVALLIPLALLAVPILDTLFVVLKRLKHRQSIASADKWHLHHRLLNVGYSPRRVTVAFWLWTASLSALALAMRFVSYGNSDQWILSGLGILSIFVVIALGFTIYLAFVLEIFKTRSVRRRNAADRAHLSVVSAIPDHADIVNETDDDSGAEQARNIVLGEGHDRAAGIATDPRDD